MSKNVWLYFDSVEDDDNTTSSTNVMFNASKLRAIVPNDIGTLGLHFNSLRNKNSATHDFILLNNFANLTHLDIGKSIVRAINNNTPTFDGFVCVSDNLKTLVDGSSVQPEYLTDRDGTESGKIASTASISLMQLKGGGLKYGNHTITATDDGSGTGQIPESGSYYIKNDNDVNHIIKLPDLNYGYPGMRVELYGVNDGYELQAFDPENESINQVSGAGKSCAIPATVEKVECFTYGASNNWICYQYDTGAGDYETVPTAD